MTTSPDIHSGSESMNRKSTLQVIITSLAFLFFFEATRELIGATYNMNLATMSINSSVVAIFAFFSPILYFFGLSKINGYTLVLASGIVLAGCRLAMGLDLAISMYLLCTVAAVMSFGVLLPALIVTFRNSRDTAGALSGIVGAVAVSAGVDCVFRALGDTFDISVYGVTASRLTSFVVVLPLVLLLVICLVLWYRASDVTPQRTELNPKKVRSTFGYGAGILFFLFITFLMYPNDVACWTGGSYPLTAVLFACALGAFLVAWTTKVRNWLASGIGLLISGIIIVFAFAALVYVPVPLLAIVLAALAVFFAPVQVHGIIHYLIPADTKKVASFLVVAAGTLIVLLLFSVFTLTYSYVPGMGFLRGQMGTIFMVAALLLLLSNAAIRGKSPIQGVPPPRRILAVLGVLIIVGTSAGVFMYQSNPVPPGEELAVMTYNIHQGYNTEGKINPWEILGPIQQVNPDILALQESDMNRLSGTNVDIVQWLAHKLDMYVYFGPKTCHQIYGVAILSKFPLHNTETYFLTSIEDQRVLVRGDIQWNGQPLSVYAVHMGLSEEDRTTQTAEILEILSENANVKILMGDLNSLPGSEQIKAFTAVLSDAWVSSGHSPTDPAGYTFDSLEPHRRIDYILVSKEVAHRIKTCTVIRSVHGSDHMPVWAEIA
jgi:endonuclease/exonuclease/phosphatase family metal-dependent hydrolase